MADLRERVRRELATITPSAEGFERTLRVVGRRGRNRSLGTGVVGVLVAVGLAVGLRTVFRPVSPSERPVSPPAANGLLWFEVAGEGRGEDLGVWEIGADGSGLRKVLDFGPVNYSQIAWSADGSRIAYANDLVGHYGILTAAPDGTDAHRLTDGDYDASPSWAPDGTRIAFAGASPGVSCDVDAETLCPTDIYAVRADGTSRVRLTDDPAPEYDPAWSPDGTKIAFARAADSTAGVYQIVVVGADGTDERIVTSEAGAFPHPTWSPDGTHLAFVGRVGGIDGVYLIDAQGTAPHLIAAQTGSFIAWPAWSPDGTKIAFVSDGAGVPVPGCGTDGLCAPQVFFVNPDGTGLKLLTEMRTGVARVAWRPVPA